MSNPLEAVAIVGIGHTIYSRGSGCSEWELANQAISRALADADLEPGAVNGIIRSAADSVDEAMVLRTFPMRLTYYGQINYGGIGLPAALAHAKAAIMSKQADVVLCYRALNGYSKTRYGRAERALDTGPGKVVARGDRAPYGAFAAPYGLLSPGQVMALWATRYQAAYGLSVDDLRGALATIALGQRAYAHNNPDAIMRDRPLTAEGYLAARVISTPLRLYDFALESDGAAAIIVASADVAKSCPQPPVWVRAGIQGLVRYGETMNVYGEPRNSETYRALAAELYRRAQLRPADITAAMLYDATTVTVLLALEEYGFYPEGNAWRGLIETGIGLDSPLPINTSGGQLSEAYVHSFNLLIEAVRQCRGTSVNQIKNPRHVLCCSGPSAVILSS